MAFSALYLYYNITALLQKSIWDLNQGAKTPAAGVGVGRGKLELEEGRVGAMLMDSLFVSPPTPAGEGECI